MKTLFHISSLLNNHLVEEEPAYHFYSFEEFWKEKWSIVHRLARRGGDLWQLQTKGIRSECFIILQHPYNTHTGTSFKSSKLGGKFESHSTDTIEVAGPDHSKAEV